MMPLAMMTKDEKRIAKFAGDAFFDFVEVAADHLDDNAVAELIDEVVEIMGEIDLTDDDMENYIEVVAILQNRLRRV